MRASPLIQRLVLQYLAAQAAAVPQTFISLLQSTAFGTVTTNALSGKFVIEAELSGVLTRYEIPGITSQGASGMSPQDVSEMLSHFLDLYAQAIGPTATLYETGYGGGLTGGIGANDAAILAWMLVQKTPVHSFSPDFSAPNLR